MPVFTRAAVVLEAAQKEIRVALALGRLLERTLQSRGNVEHRVDHVRVVDLVRTDERRVDRPGRLAPKEVIQEVRSLQERGKRRLWIPVLPADDSGQILPFGMFRIRGRVERMWPDVAETARHADAEGTHQARIGTECRIYVVPVVGVLDFLLPILARLFSRFGIREEIGIEEKPQSENAARIAVNGGIETVLYELFSYAVRNVVVEGLRVGRVGLLLGLPRSEERSGVLSRMHRAWDRLPQLPATRIVTLGLGLRLVRIVLRRRLVSLSIGGRVVRLVS